MKIKITLYNKIFFLIGIIFIISIIFLIMRGIADLFALGILFLFYLSVMVLNGINKKLEKSSGYTPEKEITKFGKLLAYLLIISPFIIIIIIAFAGIEQYSTALLIAIGMLCIPIILFVKYGFCSTK